MNLTKIDWEKVFSFKFYITFNNSYEYKLFKEKLYLEFKNVSNYVCGENPYCICGRTDGSERFGNIVYILFGKQHERELEDIKTEYIHQMTEFMLPLEVKKSNEIEKEREIRLIGRQAGQWVSGNEGSIDMAEYRRQMEEDIEKYNGEKAFYEWTEGIGTWAYSDKNKRYMGWD